jgi:tRNA 2-thiocytidine biosynthesis protein TtcA
MSSATSSAPTSALERRLLRRIARLNKSHGLLEPGDRVLVACSGGKDSWALLHLLHAYRRIVPFEFEIVAMNLDQGHPGFPAESIRSHFERLGGPYRMIHQDTWSVVREKVAPGDTTCALCSHLRRGVLYRVADEVGANKVALGHHRDDTIETLLLNAFFAGTLKAMPPRLAADNGRHVLVRPLLGCAEADLAAYAASTGAPIIPCDLCGSQPHLQRRRVKELLASLEAEHPGIRDSLFAALGNVVPTHLVGPVGMPAPGPESALLPAVRLLR